MLPCANGGAVRFANADELVDYDVGKGGEVTTVTERETFEESIFLGLRMNEGVAVNSLRQLFAGLWVDECAERVVELAREGLMSANGERWRLTQRGRLLSSEVFGELLAGASV
jgi:oxygen-independent coproporphyrinogen-3 oxidase